ncbi:hypothetical protein FA13DRAFT_958931 [Coprinellus micaceus]|uniref:Uncharacterized protein n=1 Tax=Coprinellus micaceus TaxID=71717 RepID=A0A4Y7RWZ5_COPMI|nr:hypothetical protein FA13DRAFT_958931 [Coprinellus micaceus]
MSPGLHQGPESDEHPWLVTPTTMSSLAASLGHPLKKKRCVLIAGAKKIFSYEWISPKAATTTWFKRRCTLRPGVSWVGVNRREGHLTRALEHQIGFRHEIPSISKVKRWFGWVSSIGVVGSLKAWRRGTTERSTAGETRRTEARRGSWHAWRRERHGRTSNTGTTH